MQELGWVALAVMTSFVVNGCGDPPTDARSDGGVADGGCAVSCDDGTYCNGAERCAPADPAANAAGCVPGAPPCGDGACVEAERRCEGGCADVDGDGFADVACGGDDCDDADARRFPGNLEICDDGHDEDCDPTTLGRDLDLDGQQDARCCNGDVCGRDCDDERPMTNDGGEEICDGRDNDCDGMVDEGVTLTFYRDLDNDNFGDPDSPLEACDRPDGYELNADDCDDTDPNATGVDTADTCDGYDNDCDGMVDEDEAIRHFADEDGDGLGCGARCAEGARTEFFCEGMAPHRWVLDPSDCDDNNDLLGSPDGGCPEGPYTLTEDENSRGMGGSCDPGAPAKRISLSCPFGWSRTTPCTGTCRVSEEDRTTCRGRLYCSTCTWTVTCDSRDTRLGLLISEYVEGSGNNKALELANRGFDEERLDGCALVRHQNGAVDTERLALSGSLAPGATLVVCNPGVADASACDLVSGFVVHNGDDAYTLECDDVVIDAFGQVGTDPGESWTGVGVETRDRTLRRQCRITRGDTDGSDEFDPSLEFEGHPVDDSSGLGVDCE